MATCGKDSCWSTSWRTVSRERDLTLEQGKSMRNPPPEEEGAAETRCDELTSTPVLRPPVPFRGGRQRKMGLKLSPAFRYHRS